MCKNYSLSRLRSLVGLRRLEPTAEASSASLAQLNQNSDTKIWTSQRLIMILCIVSSARDLVACLWATLWQSELHSSTSSNPRKAIARRETPMGDFPAKPYSKHHFDCQTFPLAWTWRRMTLLGQLTSPSEIQNFVSCRDVCDFCR